jgi:uncharacterized membrane protein YccF (DUF307 family)
MTAAPTSPTTVVIQEGGPNLLIRIVWFLFIGWWLSGIVSGVAWLLNVTILGLPLGLYLLNRIPAVSTLKSPRKELLLTLDEAGTTTTAAAVRPSQRPFWQRALFFVLVGWWFSGVWMTLAWIASVTILGLPLGFWMYGATGKITTLKR